MKNQNEENEIYECKRYKKISDLKSESEKKYHETYIMKWLKKYKSEKHNCYFINNSNDTDNKFCSRNAKMTKFIDSKQNESANTEKPKYFVKAQKINTNNNIIDNYIIKNKEKKDIQNIVNCKENNGTVYYKILQSGFQGTGELICVRRKKLIRCLNNYIILSSSVKSITFPSFLAFLKS